MCRDIQRYEYHSGEQPNDTYDDPHLLVQQAIATLETLNSALEDSQAYWLHGIIDVLRIYADYLPQVPNHFHTTHCSDGIILRRGLQSFVVAEDEFAEVRNAFRRSNHYRKRQNAHLARRRLTLP